MDWLSRPLIFVIGLALGTLFSAAWFLGMPPKPLSDTSFASTSVTSTSTNSMSPASGAVSVSDQKAGDSVLIDSVTVPPPGVWVAVREMAGSSLGNVLGAARARNPMSNLSVPLLRGTVPGQTYAVELYRDDGDGMFDANQDSVYVDFDTGQRVVVLFKTLQ
jgi:hypothetical protein